MDALSINEEEIVKVPSDTTHREKGTTMAMLFIYQAIDGSAISGNIGHSLVNVSPGQYLSNYLRPLSEFGQVPDAPL
jgi:hypothetical protein